MAKKEFRPIPQLRDEDIRRFWSKVEKHGEEECWPYTGTILKTNGQPGYGQFGTRGHKRTVSSRIAYFLSRGQDPGRLMVCHSCDHKSCCNPGHLFLGTHEDNMRDGVKKHRFPRGAGHHSTRGTMVKLKGEGNAQSKLTEEAVREIRRAYAAGEANQYELADRFNVHQSCVWLILKRKKWQHVT